MEKMIFISTINWLKKASQSLTEVKMHAAKEELCCSFSSSTALLFESFHSCLENHL